MIKQIEVSFHALAKALSLPEGVRVAAVDGDLTRNVLVIVIVDVEGKFAAYEMSYDAELKAWVKHENPYCGSGFP